MSNGAVGRSASNGPATVHRVTMARMSNWMQGLMGAGIALIVFAVGFGVGRTTAESRREDTPASGDLPRVQVVFPERLNLDISGIGSDRAACLDWVSKHFDGPNVGQFAMMCGAGTR